MNLRIALLTLFCCVLGLPCHADFTLTPGVDMRMEYNDNIYLDSDNEEDDVITTVTPNVSMTWKRPHLDLSLSARLSMVKYLDHTDEDRIGADTNQAATLNALARLYRELLFLRVTDTYSRVPVNEGGRGGESNTTINLTDSNTLRINPYLQFPLMRGTWMNLGYTYTNQWYEEDDANDYISHLYSASLTNELSSRVTVTVSGSYQEYRPKDADEDAGCNWFGCPEERGGRYDYDQESVSVGLSYEATERLRLNGTYGHTWLDYDVKGKGDTEEWQLGADYDITSNYSVGAEGKKSVNISVDNGATETYRYSTYLKYVDRFTVNFTLFARSSEYVEIDRDEDSYGGALTGELPLNEKIGITGLLRYENFDRTGQDAERFDRYGTSFSLYLETRLGRVSTGYTYNRTESDLDGGDYDNNIVFVQASLTF